MHGPPRVDHDSNLAGDSVGPSFVERRLELINQRAELESSIALKLGERADRHGHPIGPGKFQPIDARRKSCCGVLAQAADLKVAAGRDLDRAVAVRPRRRT